MFYVPLDDSEKLYTYSYLHNDNEVLILNVIHVWDNYYNTCIQYLYEYSIFINLYELFRVTPSMLRTKLL